MDRSATVTSNPFVPAEKRFSNKVRMEMLHHFTAFRVVVG